MMGLLFFTPLKNCIDTIKNSKSHLLKTRTAAVDPGI